MQGQNDKSTCMHEHALSLQMQEDDSGGDGVDRVTEAMQNAIVSSQEIEYQTRQEEQINEDETENTTTTELKVDEDKKEETKGLNKEISNDSSEKSETVKENKEKKKEIVRISRDEIDPREKRAFDELKKRQPNWENFVGKKEEETEIEEARRIQTSASQAKEEKSQKRTSETAEKGKAVDKVSEESLQANAPSAAEEAKAVDKVSEESLQTNAPSTTEEGKAVDKVPGESLQTSSKNIDDKAEKLGNIFSSQNMGKLDNVDQLGNLYQIRSPMSGLASIPRSRSSPKRSILKKRKVKKKISTPLSHSDIMRKSAGMIQLMQADMVKQRKQQRDMLMELGSKHPRTIVLDTKKYGKGKKKISNNLNLHSKRTTKGSKKKVRVEKKKGTSRLTSGILLRGPRGMMNAEFLVPTPVKLDSTSNFEAEPGLKNDLEQENNMKDVNPYLALVAAQENGKMKRDEKPSPGKKEENIDRDESYLSSLQLDMKPEYEKSTGAQQPSLQELYAARIQLQEHMKAKGIYGNVRNEENSEPPLQLFAPKSPTMLRSNTQKKMNAKKSNNSEKLPAKHRRQGRPILAVHRRRANAERLEQELPRPHPSGVGVHIQDPSSLMGLDRNNRKKKRIFKNLKKKTRPASAAPFRRSGGSSSTRKKFGKLKVRKQRPLSATERSILRSTDFGPATLLKEMKVGMSTPGISGVTDINSCYDRYEDFEPRAAPGTRITPGDVNAALKTPYDHDVGLTNPYTPLLVRNKGEPATADLRYIERFLTMNSVQIEKHIREEPFGKKKSSNQQSLKNKKKQVKWTNSVGVNSKKREKYIPLSRPKQNEANGSRIKKKRPATAGMLRKSYHVDKHIAKQDRIVKGIQEKQRRLRGQSASGMRRRVALQWSHSTERNLKVKPPHKNNSISGKAATKISLQKKKKPIRIPRDHAVERWLVSLGLAQYAAALWKESFDSKALVALKATMLGTDKMYEDESARQAHVDTILSKSFRMHRVGDQLRFKHALMEFDPEVWRKAVEASEREKSQKGGKNASFSHTKQATAIDNDTMNGKEDMYRKNLLPAVHRIYRQSTANNVSISFDVLGQLRVSELRPIWQAFDVDGKGELTLPVAIDMFSEIFITIRRLLSALKLSMEKEGNADAIDKYYKVNEEKSVLRQSRIDAEVSVKATDLNSDGNVSWLEMMEAHPGLLDIEGTELVDDVVSKRKKVKVKTKKRKKIHRKSIPRKHAPLQRRKAKIGDDKSVEKQQEKKKIIEKPKRSSPIKSKSPSKEGSVRNVNTTKKTISKDTKKRKAKMLKSTPQTKQSMKKLTSTAEKASAGKKATKKEVLPYPGRSPQAISRKNVDSTMHAPEDSIKKKKVGTTSSRKRLATKRKVPVGPRGPYFGDFNGDSVVKLQGNKLAQALAVNDEKAAGKARVAIEAALIEPPRLSRWKKYGRYIMLTLEQRAIPPVLEYDSPPPAVPKGWQMKYDEEGNLFYFHEKSRASLWEIPEFIFPSFRNQDLEKNEISAHVSPAFSQLSSSSTILEIEAAAKQACLNGWRYTVEKSKKSEVPHVKFIHESTLAIVESVTVSVPLVFTTDAHYAAVQLQTVFRGGRDRVRMKEIRAARNIQSNARRWSTRKTYLNQRAAATIISSNLRGMHIRVQSHRQRICAVKLQCAFRMLIARVAVRDLKRQREREEAYARATAVAREITAGDDDHIRTIDMTLAKGTAITRAGDHIIDRQSTAFHNVAGGRRAAHVIVRATQKYVHRLTAARRAAEATQKLYRGRVARETLRVQHDAATKLQSIERGRTGRKYAEERKRFQRADGRMGIAESKVREARRAMEILEKQKASAMEMKPASIRRRTVKEEERRAKQREIMKASLSSSSRDGKDENVSNFFLKDENSEEGEPFSSRPEFSTLLQQETMREASRAEMEQRNRAAITVQRRHRGIVVRQEMQKDCQAAFDFRREAMEREKQLLEEKEKERKGKAVTTVSRHYRGFQSRQELKQKKENAVQLQRVYRGRLGRKELNKISVAFEVENAEKEAMTEFEKEVQKMREIAQNRAAVVVQSRVRGWQARRLGNNEDDISDESIPLEEEDVDEQTTREQRWRKSFEAVDADGDGYINAKELIELLEGLGHMIDIHDAIALVVIGNGDDGSGHLNFVEVKGIILGLGGEVQV
eukprot:g2644.t1